MADNKKNNGEEMSVDELVSRLRDNISSADLPVDDSESASNKTISKKQDPDKDIASMLKKFMPEENAESDDFELDETVNESADDVDFELEGDSEYDVELPIQEADNAGVSEFEIDDISAAIFAEDFAEPDAGVIEDFIPEEDEAFINAISFEADDNEAKQKNKKKKGGLFGLGRKKGGGLADGYAKMLEMELESENADVVSPNVTEAPIFAEPEQLSFESGFDLQADEPSNEVEENQSFEPLAVDPMTFDLAVPPPAPFEDKAEEPISSEAPVAQESVDPFDLFDSDMPELEAIHSNENNYQNANAFTQDSPEEPESKDDKSFEISFAENTEPVPSQMFVFDNNTSGEEPEEEYFAPEKKPLAFDDDDETPIVPDESAFADVGPSDVSAFASENATSEDAPIVPPEELNDKDINLMLALGYEDELEKAIGKENVDVISDHLSAEIVDFIDIDNAYAFDGFEINSPDRFRAVGNRYKQEHFLMKLRLFGTGIFAIALFLFELLGMFGVTLGGALNIHQYPVVGIMLSLQFLVLAAAISWRQVLAGLYDAITFKPSPNSIPSVAVLMTVIYDIIMALIAPHSGLQLYNFPAALCLVFLVLNDYFNLSREIRAFNTIATRRPKYAVSTVNAAEKSAEEEMMAIFANDVQNHHDDKVLETRRVGFIDNYFRRTNIRSNKNRNLCMVIFPFIALAIALGIVSFVTNKSGVTAFNVSILTILFGMPMSSLFVSSYPFFSAVKTSFEKDATIIGEESIEEYSDAATVIFADKEVFPTEATVTKGIKLYDNNAIYYVLYHLTSLYSKIGGPLKERLEQATTELGHSEDVQIIRVAEKGVEATVDGKVHVLAGQAAFMAEKGIAIGYDPDDDRMIAEGASALYLVLDGVLSAKLYVNYELDPEFENVITSLAGENMETVIRTSDPNIDDELISAKLPVSRFPVRIIKCSAEENEDVETAEAGIVARNSLTSLARTIALCNKIRRVRKTSKKVSIISMVISLIIMVFLALFSSELGVPSIYVALYQIFWMIPMFLFTKLYVK